MTLVGWIIAMDVMWSIPQLIFRAEEKPYIYITNSLLNVLGSLTLNLLFVLKLGMGIYGVLLSNFIVSGSLFLLTLPAILKRIKLSAISVLAWKKMMRFGLPFLPSGIFAMIMELADRYILKEMATLGWNHPEILEPCFNNHTCSSNLSPCNRDSKNGVT